VTGSGHIEWVKTFTVGTVMGASNDNQLMMVDAQGRLTIATSFLGEADFGSGKFVSQHQAIGGDGSDVVIAQLDASGNPAWSQAWNGTGWNAPVRMEADASGNVYLAVEYGHSLMSGGLINVGGQQFQGDEYADVLFARIDPAGQVAWAKSFGGTPRNLPNGLAVDGAGNAFLMMIHNLASSGIDFGQGYIHGDSFFIRFDPSGTSVWSRPGTADGKGEVFDVHLNPTGMLEASAFVWDEPTDLGGGQLLEPGVYLATYDTDGNYVAAQMLMSGSLSASFSGIDDSGNRIFLAEPGVGTVDFGGGPMSDHSTERFLVAYDATGALRWMKNLGDARVQQVRVSPGGDVLVVGHVEKTLVGLGEPLEIQNKPSVNGNSFAARLDKEGNTVWAALYGCAEMRSAAFGPDGAAYIGVELRGYVHDGLLDLGFGSAPVPDENNRRLVVKFAP
jgi:hypothetical protein